MQPAPTQQYSDLHSHMVWPHGIALRWSRAPQRQRLFRRAHTSNAACRRRARLQGKGTPLKRPIPPSPARIHSLCLGPYPRRTHLPWPFWRQTPLRCAARSDAWLGHHPEAGCSRDPQCECDWCSLQQEGGGLLEEASCGSQQQGSRGSDPLTAKETRYLFHKKAIFSHLQSSRPCSQSGGGSTPPAACAWAAPAT